MEAGTLVEWMVKPGDQVKRGDVVAVVETQKGAIEIEIFETGEIEKILVDLDSKVPVGTPLAIVRREGQPAGVAEPAPPPWRPAVPPAPPPVPSVPARKPFGAEPTEEVGRLRVSPVARRLAQQHGVDLALIKGTGPGGAIVQEDIERTLAEAPAERKRAAGLDLNAMRVAIGAAMARSKREIPHYYLQHQVDVTRCEEWIADTNTPRPPADRLLMGALNVKAAARAARRFPAFNGFYREDRFEASEAINAGMAIAIRGGGLAAPALHDADKLSLDDLMAKMRDLVARMRAGRIRGSEMADPTITISSLGERGVEALYGIIYPPQVAIVGFGKAVQRPWVVDGKIIPRSVMTITLSADHRVSDGHAGALFLAEIGRLLEEPEAL
jgi:pyruvate dehydrogenase E2 component (dihydrolipoamide acetyltransferase)